MPDEPIFQRSVVDRAFAKAARNITTMAGLRHYVACRKRLDRFLCDEPSHTPTSACEMLASYVDRWAMKQGHNA